MVVEYIISRCRRPCLANVDVFLFFFVFVRVQMVFISGEGGGAGSRLTQDVGSILAQLPDTVESLTGGGQAGVHQTALSGVSCTTISSILMASTSTISRDPRRVSVRLFVALLSQISKYITNLKVGASLNNLRGSPCFQALFHVFRVNLTIPISRFSLTCLCDYFLAHFCPSPQRPYSSGHHQRAGALLRGRRGKRLGQGQP